MTETQLQERLNKILVDIVSVTDEVRMEQLRDEYNDVESMLEKQREITGYLSLYRTCSLSEALEKTNNINVSEICKMFKLRPLTGLDNVRVLVSFLSACDATLVILDVGNVIVDTIGRGSKEYRVYVYCLSKYNLDMTPCVSN